MQNVNRRVALSIGLAASVALIAGCSSGPNAEKNESKSVEAKGASEPTYALITQPVGASAPANYIELLEQARNEGLINKMMLLNSKPSVEGPVGFSSLAVLEFPSESAYKQWSREDASALGSDLVVRQADILVDDRATSYNAKSAFVVSHYEALIPAEDYAEYTRTYITPNMDGQKRGGVMSGYAMYYEKEPVPGIKGNRTVLVKQYVDESAFGRSEAIKEKDKLELLKNPEWKRINDTKATLRNDISGTLALPVPQD